MLNQANAGATFLIEAWDLSTGTMLKEILLPLPPVLHQFGRSFALERKANMTHKTENI